MSTRTKEVLIAFVIVMGIVFSLNMIHSCSVARVESESVVVPKNER